MLFSYDMFFKINLNKIKCLNKMTKEGKRKTQLWNTNCEDLTSSKNRENYDSSYAK